MANRLDRIGQRMGDYRLLRWLGGGGFGDVYLAEQVRNHSQVAIKLLHIRLGRCEELKAFLNEARTIRLKHAHIIPLLDFGISRGGIPFLAMEYIAQGTLRDRHPQGSQVPLSLVVSYAQQIGSALGYAHEQRLIHCDVKPENMLLRDDGTVLLSDFGLAVVAHSSPSLDPSQGMVGTISYMAPEQLQKQARVASDQYSLGVVVYEWITGHPPFEGIATEVAIQHVMAPPPSLVAQVPGLAREVEGVVLKALAKDPKERFVSVLDFTTALRRAVRGALVVPEVHEMFSENAHNLTCTFDTGESATSSLVIPGNHSKPIVSPDMRDLLVSSQRVCPAAGPRAPAASPRVDWGDALKVPIFYGREEEQALLTQWVVQERCRVVSVLGMGGIGKSALVITITLQLIKHFEVVIVRSLRNLPSCEALLDDCLQVLSAQSNSTVPATLEQRINLLLSLLRQYRVLLVLDNLEGLLEPGDVRGQFRPAFEGYRQLLCQVAEASHQSCLLFTSRERPAELRPQGKRYSSVRSLRLAGLGVAACKQLLEEKRVVGTEEEQARLISVYAGNPLDLKVVAETIVDLFSGEIGPFLASGTVIFSSITDLLDEQFARLSPLEKSVLYWLAIVQEPVTFDELHELLVIPLSRLQLLEAVGASYRRSLIERGNRPGSFLLQSVVLEYVTGILIAEASDEVQQHRLDKLIQYGLFQVHAKEDVRQTKERLLISRLLTELENAYRGWDKLEVQLLSLLDQLRGKFDSAQGYGPANLIALLRQRGHQGHLNLSQLCIRGA